MSDGENGVLQNDESEPISAETKGVDDTEERVDSQFVVGDSGDSNHIAAMDSISSTRPFGDVGEMENVDLDGVDLRSGGDSGASGPEFGTGSGEDAGSGSGSGNGQNSGVDGVDDGAPQPNEAVDEDDAGKEEAFVDAPDQLVPVVGKSGQPGEPVEVIDQDGVGSSDEIHQSGDSCDSTKDEKLRSEMEELRGQLDILQIELEKMTTEKEKLKQELEECKRSFSCSSSWQEERERFLKELADLHHQLELLREQQLVIHKDNDGVVNRHLEVEEGEGLLVGSVSDLPVLQMFDDCSKIIEHVKDFLNQRLQSEGTIKELHAVLFTKDQEMEDLNTKLNELCRIQNETVDSNLHLLQMEKEQERLREQVIRESIAHDVAICYMSSIHQDLVEEESSARAVADYWETYLDAFCDGLLSSLSKINHTDHESVSSVAERVTLVQQDAMKLAQNHEELLHLVESLGSALVEVDTETTISQEERCTAIINQAHGQILESRGKQSELNEVIVERTALEEENRKLLEQLNKAKEDLEASNAERVKTETELEKSDKKLQSLKEKLSMAVTKGKSLVQQRDALRKTLTEKTDELEKCLSEVREKSDALKMAEDSYRENASMMEKELARNQDLVDSLQQSLSMSTSALQMIEEIFMQVIIPEELQSEDITVKVQWLVNQKGTIEGRLLERDTIFQKLKSTLRSFDLPQSVSSMELVYQVEWLGKTLLEAREEILLLQSNLSESQSSTERYKSELLEVQREIEVLHASLFAEKNAKVYLQEEFDSLIGKHSEISENIRVVSFEKDELIRKLLDVAGEKVDYQEPSQHSLDSGILERCFEKITDRINDSSNASEELQRLQSLLDAKDQELDGCKRILDEAFSKEEQHLSEIAKLTKEAKNLVDEVTTLRNERDALLKELGTVDDKIQELEQCRKMLEAASAIEEEHALQAKDLMEESNRLTEEVITLRNERDVLQKELGMAGDKLQELDGCRNMLETMSSKEEESINAINNLLEESKRLGEEVTTLTNERDILQKELDMIRVSVQALEECKKMLEAASSKEEEYMIERLNLTEESTRLRDEITTLKNERDMLQKDLVKAEEKSAVLREKLSMAVKKGKGLVQEKESWKLSMDKKNEEIEKLKSEVQHLETTFHEYKDQMNSLSSDLRRIPYLESDLLEIKNQKAQAERSLLESNNKLHRVLYSLGSICLPGDPTLGDPVDRVELVASYFCELQIQKNNAIEELERAKEEAGIHAVKLADAYAAIKKLEDTLSKTEADLSALQDEKKKSETANQTIVTDLQIQLFGCMEQLAGAQLRLEKQTAELDAQLNCAEKMKVNMKQLLQLLTERSSKAFEGLRAMELLFHEILNQTSQTNNAELLEKKYSSNKGVQTLELSEQFAPAHLNEMGFLHGATIGEIDGMDLHLKFLSDYFENYSTSLDHQIGILLHQLERVKMEVMRLSDSKESLQLNVVDLEAYKKTHQSLVPILQKNIGILLAACIGAVQEMKNAEEDDLLSIKSKVQLKLPSNVGELKNSVDAHQGATVSADDCMKAAGNLLSAAGDVRNQIQHFQDVDSERCKMIKELQKKLIEAEHALENEVHDRDLCQTKLLQMECDLEELKISCQALTCKLEDYQKKEDALREKEVELSSLYETKDEDQVADYIQSKAQLVALCEKVEQLEIVYPKMIENIEPSGPVDKIFYVFDHFNKVQESLNACLNEGEELKEILEVQNREIAHLKQESEKLLSNNQDTERKRNELIDLMSGMERIIQKLGGHEILVDKKPVGARSLLQVLEKMVMSVILESDASKLKAQEMDAKRHTLQMKMDGLLAKNKLLEDSLLEREAPSYVINDKGAFEASTSANGSEISEIEDMGQQGKNSIPSTSPASLRTMYKGSSDHLVLNIDMESNHLVNHHEDDDKGHVFKSLNSSGLIPKQGKLTADRIDGIWVSGSRILMKRPGARISLIAYWVLLHIWVLATII